MLVLVVDDEESLCELLAEILEDSYEVITANDGQEALAKTIQFKPDLVISDIMMPQMSGIELLEAIRNDPAIAHTPVILLSAVPQNVQALQDKAEAFLRKPYEIDVIENMVGNILKDRSAEDIPSFSPVPFPSYSAM